MWSDEWMVFEGDAKPCARTIKHLPEMNGFVYIWDTPWFLDSGGFILEVVDRRQLSQPAKWHMNFAQNDWILAKQISERDINDH